MNKSAILLILLALFLIICFDVCWYCYITDTLIIYGVDDSDIVKRLDKFLFCIGFELFIFFVFPIFRFFTVKHDRHILNLRGPL